MVATFIVNILAVLFAWLDSRKLCRYGLGISVFIIFVFLALRFDFGNDYPAYLQNFLNINRYHLINVDSFNIKGNEIAWFYLNRFFKPFGFFSLIIVLAAFNCYVLYRFIKKYVPQRYYWFAIFLYTFQTSQMLILSSAMRQAVAVSFFLIAIDFIVKKKIIHYFVTIFIASLFHTSSIILLPLILLSYLNWNLKLRHIVLVLTLFVLPLFLLDKTANNLNIFTNQYFNTYSYYLDNSDGISISDIGIGFVINVSFYVVILYYSQFEFDKTNKLFFKIAVISLLIIPLGFTIQLIGRLNFYFLPSLMVVFPLVFLKMRNRSRNILIGSIIVFTLYNFYLFFNRGVYAEHFKDYKTILTSLNWM